MDIAKLINNRDKLNAMTLRELRNLVERYPFYHLARMLYVANLYAMHDPTLSEELTKASLLVPDRTVLFDMIEGHNYELEKNNDHNIVETEDDDNRTISLIDDFLSNVKNDAKENDEKPHTVPTIADLTNDYAAFLQMQEDVTPQEEPIEGEGGQDELIDSFIQANKGKQRYEMKDSDEEPTGPQETSNEHIEEIFNENIVNIYIKQGRYQQALEILKSICLNNPEKSANFASQMRLLEVVVNNNKESKQQ